jgi:(R,R)-butanediol dehydrogenase / meso-butanediol dehydrogenase / diacetyl reductase
MKALRWYKARDIRLEEVPEPVPGSGEVKVKIKYAGICGTDLREYAVGPYMIPPGKAPITLGHEFSGTVADIGRDVKNFKPGDRVTGLGYRYCGRCYCCKRMKYNICYEQGFTGLTADGCIASCLVTPEYTCFKLPDSVSDESGSLVEPLSVAVHAVKQGGVQPGDTVAIIGDGTIGLCVLLAARAVGASEVHMVSKHEKRAARAIEMGATTVSGSLDNPAAAIRNHTGGIGADVSFECVGNNQTTQLAVDSIHRGGTAVVVGLFEKSGEFNFGEITLGEKKIVGSSIYIREAEAVIAMLADGRLKPDGLISSIVPLDETAGGIFKDIMRDKENNLKVLFRIN